MKESSLAGKLRRLGSTPKAVAANLKARGIKGIDGDCALCPIANFLAQTTKGAKAVSIGGETATVFFNNYDHVQTRLPQACREFIEGFDSGLFPRLACSYEDVKKFNPLER